jgi:hypothetical protein
MSDDGQRCRAGFVLPEPNRAGPAATIRLNCGWP